MGATRPIERPGPSFAVRRKRKERRWLDRLLVLAGLSRWGRLPRDMGLALH